MLTKISEDAIVGKCCHGFDRSVFADLVISLSLGPVALFIIGIAIAYNTRFPFIVFRCFLTLHFAGEADNMKKRYDNDLIYTYIGPVLISINPYRQLGNTGENLVSTCKCRIL